MLTVACANAPLVRQASSPAPRLERLRERVRAEQAAWAARDAAVLYAMRSPTRGYTLEEFMRDFGLDKTASEPRPRIKGGYLEAVCKCGPAPATAGGGPRRAGDRRCVILVATEVEARPGQIEKLRLWHMWEYVGDEWYWGYPGESGPEEGQPPCPR